MAEKLTVRVGLSESENARLKSIDEYRLNFLTSISTALQEPLTTIQLRSQTLRMEMYGRLNQAQMASVQEIHQAADMEQDLLTKLIELSQAQQKQLKMRHEVFTLENVVTTAARQVKKRYAGKFIDLQTDIPLTLPTLSGDFPRMAQVFEDLLTWAFENVSARSVVQLHAVAGKNDVAVSLITTGHVLTPSEQSSFFDLFPTTNHPTPADRTTTTGGVPGNVSSAINNNNMGLGLAFVKALIEQQGGSIRVQPGANGNIINFNILFDSTN